MVTKNKKVTAGRRGGRTSLIKDDATKPRAVETSQEDASFKLLNDNLNRLRTVELIEDLRKKSANYVASFTLEAFEPYYGGFGTCRRNGVEIDETFKIIERNRLVNGEKKAFIFCWLEASQ